METVSQHQLVNKEVQVEIEMSTTHVLQSSSSSSSSSSNLMNNKSSSNTVEININDQETDQDKVNIDQENYEEENYIKSYLESHPLFMKKIFMENASEQLIQEWINHHEKQPDHSLSNENEDLLTASYAEIAKGGRNSVTSELFNDIILGAASRKRKASDSLSKGINQLFYCVVFIIQLFYVILLSDYFIIRLFYYSIILLFDHLIRSFYSIILFGHFIRSFYSIILCYFTLFYYSVILLCCFSNVYCNYQMIILNNRMIL